MATLGSLGKLAVTLTANSAKLVKELAGSRKRIASWAKKVSGTIAKIGGAATAVATVISGALLVTINRTASDLDKLVKTATKLGVIPRELQAIQFAGELSGVGVDTTNMALQRMVRRVSEAAKGTGEAVKALKELNIDAIQLAQLSPDKQFYAIAEAMKDVKNQGDRVRLAMKLFDSEGVSLVNTLISDLPAVRAEFEQLGIAITASQGKMIEKFQDSKSILSGLFTGFKQQLTVQLAPALTYIIERVTQFIKEMGGMENVAKSVAKVVVSALGGIVKFGGKVITSFQKAELVIEKASLAGMRLFNIMRMTNPLLLALTDKFSDKEIADKVLSIQTIQSRIEEGIPKINKSITDFVDGINDKIGQKAASLDDVVTDMIAGGLSGPARAAFLKQKEDERNAAAAAAEQQNKVAEAAAAAANTLNKVTEARAWKDIFGAEDVTARSNQFDTYAKLVADNIQNNSKYTQSNLSTLKSILQTAIDNGAMGFSNNNLFEKLDITGMSEVIQGLEAMAAQAQQSGAAADNQVAMIESATAVKTTATNTELINQGITKQNNMLQKAIDNGSGSNKSLGKMTLELRDSTKVIAGEIFGEPVFLQRLNTFFERKTTDAARQVTS